MSFYLSLSHRESHVSGSTHTHTHTRTLSNPAACVNQCPDLFGCAVAKVGVMDMLKFHKFTIGHAWTTDYGCADHPEQFKWFIKYSPLHNLPPPPHIGAAYPAMLLLTGAHDDRVVPLHTLKYCATLQHGVGNSPGQAQPLMVRVDTRSGNGRESLPLRQSWRIHTSSPSSLRHWG
ncbi:unnamed protein product [Oncorhynchus mykiss]|uniref:Prolyl endopeptidase n=1 Tax=Oncorhynchus mykiss TaxID=8022 RepID=A0A060Z6T0_ONCMY|nr:unnamed protein product [Oncorhynchus mykiss]